MFKVKNIHNINNFNNDNCKQWTSISQGSDRAFYIMLMEDIGTNSEKLSGKSASYSKFQVLPPGFDGIAELATL